ncbi:hypothetical protein JCM3766R1_006159 [Sporobolomyces carnicolor]
MLAAVNSGRTRERTLEDGDELPFGDFCFSCGNATQGSSYCSPECRELDYRQAPASPDFSPYLSPVPPLVSSAKSACSTPPSSATNSPLHSEHPDLADPPALDLPPPKDGYTYSHSLPANAARLAATWSINYQPEPLASPLIAAIDSVDPTKDLSYRRKIDRPHPTVPSPLYFRQKAAAVHSSPALHPLSPSGAPRNAFFNSESSGAHIHDDDITLLSLPSRQADAAPTSSIVPTPSHCGRPGCIGVPKKLRVDTNVDRKPRRKSWQPSPPHPFKGFTAVDSNNSSEEILVSPRIRNLRTGRSASDEGPSVTKASRRDDGSDSDSSGDDAHSAFACYLFSHLAEPVAAAPSESRGRTTEQHDEETKRSRSVDATVATRQAVGSSTPTQIPSTPARPTRTLFSRGPAAQVRSDPAVERLTPLEPKRQDSSSSAIADSPDGEDDQAATLTLTSELRGRQRDDTIRASALPKSLTTRQRPNLLPGHFIQATTDSPSSSFAVSSFQSPPATPPTAGRGRSSSSRRFRRSLSPEDTPDDQEERSSSRSRSSRVSRSRGRGGREDETPRIRGRTRERIAAPEFDEVDEERGRGRGRQSASRSKSRSSRGRGREVVFSGGAYGHADSSDSDR